MSVYDISRVAPGAAPPGFADDIDDINFVPAPCQVACPVGTDAPSYIGYIWEGEIEEAFEAITARNLGCVVMNPLGGGLIPQNPKIFEFIKNNPQESVVEAALHFLPMANGSRTVPIDRTSSCT